jgi:hypothetical protein
MTIDQAAYLRLTDPSYECEHGEVPLATLQGTAACKCWVGYAAALLEPQHSLLDEEVIYLGVGTTLDAEAIGILADTPIVAMNGAGTTAGDDADDNPLSQEEISVSEGAAASSPAPFSDQNPLLQWLEFRDGTRRVGVGDERRGRSLNAPDYVIEQAHQLYMEGLSLRKVAARLLDQTTYASARSFANQLSTLFKNRGLPVRDRREAVVAFNKQFAAELPQCRYIPEQGPNMGLRCINRAKDPSGICGDHLELLRKIEGRAREHHLCAAKTVEGAPCRHRVPAGVEFCVTHNPANREKWLAHLAAMRARVGGGDDSGVGSAAARRDPPEAADAQAVA